MENNNASIVLYNGLGDKLLDLIGFYILCKYLNYKPNVTFLIDKHPWGVSNYDMRLFKFSEITITNEKHNFYVISHNASSSMCPYKLYVFIKSFLNEITFEQISNDFVEYSKKIIQPSEIILQKIPNNIEKAYGIHLRKTDKVSEYCDIRHENLTNEFIIIIDKLLEDVKNIIMDEEEPIFFIASEDNNWKLEIINRINNISNNNNKQIKILTVDYDNKDNYDNYISVLDMFCLSKCKEILQGVKYSTFSIVASLLGNNKLRNYSKYTNSYDVCLIHTWNSAVEVNNIKNFDIEFHKQIANTCRNLETNINKIFT